MLDIGVNTIWVQRCTYMPGKKVDLHSHTFFHYVFITGGDGIVRIGDRQLPFETGSMYMIPPNTVHEFYAGAEIPLHMIELKFEIFNTKLRERVDKLPLVMHLKDHSIESLLGKMLKEATQKIVLYTDMINVALFAVLTYLIRQSIQKSKAPVRLHGQEKLYGIRGDFAKIVLYIQEHMEEQITLETLANIMCLEKTHFLKKFKKEFGTTPIKYLNDLRLQKAKELLQFSDMNVTQIALAVGFQSIHYFSRTFSANVGITPGAFRQLNAKDQFIGANKLTIR